MTKVICIADQIIWEHLNQNLPQWDFQVPVVDIPALWEGLSNGTLSPNETRILIFSDQYYFNDDNGIEETGALAAAIATMAPHSCVMLIDYSNGMAVEGVREQIAAMPDGATDSWFVIDPANAIESINTNWETYQRATIESAEQVEGYYEEPVVEPTPDSAPAVEQETTAPPTPAPQPSGRGVVIACTSSKGGSGKSSVALLLAGQLYHSSKKAAEMGKAERPLNVCVVDMDVFDGQLGFLVGRTEPTALQLRVAMGQGLSHDLIDRHLAYDEGLGIKLLLAPMLGRTAHDTPPEFYQMVIDELREMFDVVILDTSVQYLDPYIKQVVLPTSDAILFVTNMGVSSVYGMGRWFREVTSPAEAGGGQNIDIGKIGYIINQAVPNIDMDLELIDRAASGARRLGIIPMMSGVFLVAANGNRLHELLELEEIGPAIFSIAQKVYRRAPLEPLVAPQPMPTDTGGRKPARAAQEPENEAPNKRRGLFGGRK